MIINSNYRYPSIDYLEKYLGNRGYEKIMQDTISRFDLYKNNLCLFYNEKQKDLFLATELLSDNSYAIRMTKDELAQTILDDNVYLPIKKVYEKFLNCMISLENKQILSDCLKEISSNNNIKI